MKRMRKSIEVLELNVAMPMTRDCVSDIRAIIAEARRSVVRHVNNTMTLAYWLIGRRLVVEEQKGGRRAAYGEHLLERISRELTAEFGRGFAEPQLRNCRLFYQAYPTESAIRYALRIKLSWTHHRAIMRKSVNGVRPHGNPMETRPHGNQECRGWDCAAELTFVILNVGIELCKQLL